MLVKICGITNEEDALSAVALGADAVGFVLAPSPRQIYEDDAAYLARRCPAHVLTVGVFRDQPKEFVCSVVSRARLRAVQLHGSEDPETVAWIRERVPVVIKAFGAGDPKLSQADSYPCDYMLLDSAEPGSGQVFDWKLVEGVRYPSRLILSGGLNPENVAAAIEVVKPFGVDVSSGVEKSPGLKDPVKVRAFIQAVRKKERELKERQASASPPPYDWEQEEL